MVYTGGGSGHAMLPEEMELDAGILPLLYTIAVVLDASTLPLLYTIAVVLDASTLPLLYRISLHDPSEHSS